MRWDRLFDDIESQLERELSAEELDLAAEEERVRLARLGMRDRLVALRAADPERPRRLTLRTGSRLELRINDIGRDWLLGTLITDGADRRSAVVPIPAIIGIALTPVDAAASVTASTPAGALSERLGLAFVLRDLCRRRRAVEVTAHGAVFHGTIDRVARDHLDVALHEPGTPRRASTVTEVRVIALAAIDLVRAGGGLSR